MMNSAQSEDLQALERVHDRLAATSDDKLQHVLAKLLPRLVEMMAQDLLRSKVSQIFSHLLKRVRPNDSIQLPVLYVPLLSCSVVVVCMSFGRNVDRRCDSCWDPQGFVAACSTASIAFCDQF
jgi:hypothetical protein